jgi:hypothetical protein
MDKKGCLIVFPRPCFSVVSGNRIAWAIAFCPAVILRRSLWAARNVGAAGDRFKEGPPSACFYHGGYHGGYAYRGGYGCHRGYGYGPYGYGGVAAIGAAAVGAPNCWLNIRPPSL